MQIPQADPLVWIALVMLVSGALGGVVNFIISDQREEKPLTCLQHVLVGVVAAFIVPLFLNMASGDLIDRIRGVDGKPQDYSRLLVLAGFCLLAAASSRAFIRSLSERVLQEAKAANRKSDLAIQEAAEAQAAVAPLVEIEPFADGRESVEGGPESGGAPDQANLVLSEVERKALEAIVARGFSMRSVTGIARDAGLSKAQAEAALESLATKQLVQKRWVARSREALWLVTARGRAAFASAGIVR